MNDNYRCHRNLAACYQLAQSILKIASRKGGTGEMGECHPAGDSAWWLLQLAVEKPRQAILSLPAQMGIENAPFTL